MTPRFLLATKQLHERRKSISKPRSLARESFPPNFVSSCCKLSSPPVCFGSPQSENTGIPVFTEIRGSKIM